MSGIAGFLYLDGRPVVQADLERMASTLDHRGRDGGGIWSNGSAALAHRLLHTTPESLLEVLPRRSRTSSAVLTADARIDNRDELIRLLRLGDRPAHEITDSELILYAYEQWGEQCPERLLGDYAFAIWDASHQRLFCARDAYGVNPFFYHHQPGRLFVFGSEIKALLAHEDVPDRVNEAQIRRYMHWNWGTGESTFYRDILRLPAAHALSVNASGLKTWRYWAPDPEREVRLKSDAEYEEAFREVFFEAVRCRLRSAFPVGSMLSGGIDSSSIACTARTLLANENRDALHTFSLVFDAAADCDERRFINPVLAQGGFAPHLILSDELTPLDDIDRVHWHLDEPAHVCLYALPWAKFRTAAQHSTRVLLDGLMGDEVLGNSASEWQLTNLARKGKLIRLLTTTRQYARNMGRSPWLVLRKEVARPLAPAPIARAWRALRRRPAHELNLNGMSGSFVAPSDTPGNGARAAMSRVRRTIRERHASAVDARWYHGPFGLANLMSAAHGVEVRYPFIDRRVVEFSVALPIEQKFRGGWPRSIARRSLGGILPEEVRWRTNKGHLTTWYKQGIAAVERERFDRMIFSDPGESARVIDLDALREVLDYYRSGNDSVLTSVIWMPFIMAYWLQQRSAKVSTP